MSNLWQFTNVFSKDVLRFYECLVIGTGIRTVGNVTKEPSLGVGSYLADHMRYGFAKAITVLRNERYDVAGL